MERKPFYFDFSKVKSECQNSSICHLYCKYLMLGGKVPLKFTCSGLMSILGPPMVSTPALIGYVSIL